MAKHKKKGPKSPKSVENVDILKNQSKGPIPCDVQGSYTGTPREDDQPVQDADDL
jgi:hypothetical protein